MQILELYSIRDEKGENFHRPVFMSNEASALREFSLLINDETNRTLFTTNPQDFKLYHLGTFNDNTGTIIALPIPKLVADGLSVKITKAPNQKEKNVKS